jgi:hypothetical protein
MKKTKKTEKALTEPKVKKAGRREFLERTGLTAGGVLMTTLAVGSAAKGQTLVTQQRALAAPDFQRLLDQALTDKVFQEDIRMYGFKALESRGYNFQVPKEIQASMESSLMVAEVEKPKCGVCGVCGLCGLCAEINAGSASAALWALFALA